MKQLEFVEIDLEPAPAIGHIIGKYMPVRSIQIKAYSSLLQDIETVALLLLLHCNSESTDVVLHLYADIMLQRRLYHDAQRFNLEKILQQVLNAPRLQSLNTCARPSDGVLPIPSNSIVRPPWRRPEEMLPLPLASNLKTNSLRYFEAGEGELGCILRSTPYVSYVFSQPSRPLFLDQKWLSAAHHTLGS